MLLLALAGCTQPAEAPRPTATLPPTHTSQPTATLDPTATATPEEEAPTPTSMPTAAPAVSDLLGVAWEDRALFRQGLIDAEAGALDHLPGASVYHIDLQILDDLSVVRGRQEVRYTNQEDHPLDAVYFRLFPNLMGGTATVSEVAVGGQAADPVYELKRSAVRVPLPEPLPSGEHVVIQMDFAVDLPLELEAGYGLFGYVEDMLLLHECYPVIPVYDDEGWNVELPSPFADVTYLDASFYLVRVTAPANLILVASGVEVNRAQQGDVQVVTLAAGPSRDFYLAASENYTVVSATVGETTINSYALPERVEGAALALQEAVDALESYGDHFGVYPYTEFDLVGTPMLALGMEYPGVVAIAHSQYDLDAEVYGTPARLMLEPSVVHEVAHQWFYNVVGNDQLDEPWLDEAIVQYVVGLYFTDVYGEGSAQAWFDALDSRWDRVDRAAMPIGMPVSAYTGEEYGAIIYGRGPLFIAALAEELGQKAFNEFLHDYYESHKWGIGTRVAFKQLAEAHCQCDLTPMFAVWVDAP
jgi:hypothetical protein